MLPLLIRPEADQDLKDAHQWYETRREGLGDEFLAEVEASLDFIRDFPDTAPVVHEPVHRRLVNRFPYGIFYFVDAGVLVVTAVFHCSRDPKAWKKRT